MKKTYYVCGGYIRPSSPCVNIAADADRHVNCAPGTRTFFKKASPEMITKYLNDFRRDGETNSDILARWGVEV